MTSVQARRLRGYRRFRAWPAHRARAPGGPFWGPFYGRGHRCNFPDEFVEWFVHWLEEVGMAGYVSEPEDW